MGFYACSVCGTVSHARRCPAHTGPNTGGYSPHRNRYLQAKFRLKVLTRDGFRCTYETEDGRCPARANLRAAHVKPLRDYDPRDPAAYDAANGRTLCPEHDRALDRYAR